MPYKPTGKPAGRPATPLPIVPTAPAVPPQQGSLEETVMLGDSAASRATPAAQLRWYHDRSEIQRVIQTNGIERYKDIAVKAVQAVEDANISLKTAIDENDELRRRLSKIESLLEQERWKTKSIEGLQKRIEELKPDAERWTASQIVDASSLGELAKQERQRRETAAELADIEAEIEPLLTHISNFVFSANNHDEFQKLNDKLGKLSHRKTELTEDEAGRTKRLEQEAADAKKKKQADEVRRHDAQIAAEDDKNWRRAIGVGGSRLGSDIADIRRCNLMNGDDGGILTVAK